jgi:hypothetical protein
VTLLLPKPPPRRWDPSQWNLTRGGATIVASLALGACTDDTTAADHGDTSTDATTDYSDVGDWQDGYSDDYSDDWNDDYDDGYADWGDDYGDGWYAECYIDEDCGVGMECVDNYCEPLSSECRSSSECAFDEFCDDNGSCVGVQLPSQCGFLAPEVTQIPLPAEAGGQVVALRFVQLDDDPGQELVLVRDDAIVIVDGDQATTVTHSAFALDGIAAMDVDDDGNVDLIATSSTKLNARVFLADGLGGFVDTGTGPAMMLDDVHAIDWPSGGAGELLVRTQTDQAAILSNLAAAMADVDVVEEFPVDGVAAGDFNGNGEDDYALLIGCQPVIQHQGGGGLGSDGIGPPGTCTLTVGDFDQDSRDDLAILRVDASFSVVTVFSPPDQSYAVGLIGAYTAALPAELGGIGRSVLAQFGTELWMLFSPHLEPSSWCRGQLDELPPVAQFATGDFDGDGDDELAVLGVDGLVTLWAD